MGGEGRVRDVSRGGGVWVVLGGRQRYKRGGGWAAGDVEERHNRERRGEWDWS